MNNLNLLALMGPIGIQEMIVIFLIILLLFGAKKIPELARGIGKGMGEFKKAKEDFEDEIKHGEVEGKKEWEQPSKPATPASPPSVTSTDPADPTDTTDPADTTDPTDPADDSHATDTDSKPKD